MHVCMYVCMRACVHASTGYGSVPRLTLMGQYARFSCLDDRMSINKRCVEITSVELYIRYVCL